jgi:hypothetical protein
MHIAFADNGKYVKIRNLFSAKAKRGDIRELRPDGKLCFRRKEKRIVKLILNLIYSPVTSNFS